MDNKTLKSSIKAYCLELMQEMSALGGEGAYMTKYAGRKVTSKDKTSPTGFETSPKNNYYKKFKFRVTNPYPRKNSKQLWNEIKINKPGIFKTNLLNGDENPIIVYKKHQNYQDNREEIEKSLSSQGYDDVWNRDEVTWSLISFPEDGNPNKKYWWADDEINWGVKENKKEFIHRINKEIYQKLDEINNHIEYTSKIKGSEDKEINELNILKNSLLKIKSKINEIKIVEGKQVGDLYHFTPVKSFLNMLKTQHIFPNQENQISTTRKTSIDHTSFNDSPPNSPMVRITFDGNKISTKYKIKPYNWDFSTDDGMSDEEYKQWGVKDSVAEEQIIVNGDLFPFLPYVKRIDIFSNKNKNIPYINHIEKKLKELNIPIKIYYDQTSINNIGFNQDKIGDVSNIKLPKPIKIYKDVDLYFNIPKSNGYEVELNINKDLGINNANYHMKLGYSTLYPNYYYKYLFDKNDIEKYFNFKGLEYKIIENPNIDYIRNSKEFKEKLKYSESPMSGYPRSYDYPYIALLNKDFIDKHTKHKKQIK